MQVPLSMLLARRLELRPLGLCSLPQAWQSQIFAGWLAVWSRDYISQFPWPCDQVLAKGMSAEVVWSHFVEVFFKS